jgi:hypothetical protein
MSHGAAAGEPTMQTQSSQTRPPPCRGNEAGFRNSLVRGNR